jgi:exodeoxyribonuclease VII large subunit
LAKTIALCPLPVLTGIGHSTNLTVAEMVAHTNTIVPAQTAEFLIQKLHNFSVPIQKAQSRISELATRFLSQAKNHLQNETKLLKTITHKNLMSNLQQLQFTEKQLTSETRSNLKSFAVELNHAQNQVKLLDPINTLKRGYSITRLNGKTLRQSSQVLAGDRVETTLYDGQITSIVN